MESHVQITRRPGHPLLNEEPGVVDKPRGDGAKNEPVADLPLYKTQEAPHTLPFTERVPPDE